MLRALLSRRRQRPSGGGLPVWGGERWFPDHFGYAADEIIRLLGDVDVVLRDRDVADVGAGDGIIDLGLVLKGMPRRLVGFDLRRTDTTWLLAEARRHGVASELPGNLSFVQSERTRLPAEDGSFDVAVSWSAFEHVADPTALLREVRRVLRPSGWLVIQIWPLYHSEHGGHLWDWFPDEPFLALRHTPEEIEERTQQVGASAEDLEERLEIVRTLNRITIGELQTALVSADFSIRKVDLISSAVHLPRGLDRRFALTDLAVSGVKLIAQAG